MARQTQLPSSSDMNQMAHPGGGTRITDASSEGLVEDLFETHLRHLDVATKSAVAKRLVHVASKIDSLGFIDAARVIDRMLSLASNIQEIPSSELISAITSRLDNVMSLVTSARDRPNPIGDILTPGFRSTLELNADNAYEHLNRIKAYILQGDFHRATEEINFMLSKDAMTGEWLSTSMGGEVDLGELLSSSELNIYKQIMSEVSALTERLSSESSAQRSRERRETHGSAVFQEYSDLVKDLHSRYTEVDAMTEHLEKSDPNRFKLVDAAIGKIPNIGKLVELDFYVERLGEAQRLPDKTLNARISALRSVFEPLVSAAEAALEGN